MVPPVYSSRRRFIKLLAAAAGAPLFSPLVDRTISTVRSSMARSRTPVTVFSKHLHYLDYDTLAETTVEMGFDGIDLTVRPGGHVLPEHVERDLPLAAAAAEKAGTRIVMMTTAITNPDDPFTVPILRTAGQLGIEYYRMGWVTYTPERSIGENLDFYKRQFDRLAGLNRQYGLKGAYQNHAGMYVGAAVWDLWYLLRDLPSEWIGVQYDVRHATVEGSTAWPLALEAIYPYVRITAVKDFRWTVQEGKSVIENVPLGQGMVDFDRYYSILKTHQVLAPISLHFEYPMPGELDTSSAPADRSKKDAPLMKRDLDTLRMMLDRYGL